MHRLGRLDPGDFMTTGAERSAKKPYVPPKLLIYGNLTEQTRSAGGMGHLDGGMMIGMRKTG